MLYLSPGCDWGFGEDAVDDDVDEEERERVRCCCGGVRAHTSERSPFNLALRPARSQLLAESGATVADSGGGRGGSVGPIAASEVHEKDKKLFERINKKREKIANMTAEIERIRVKEHQQGSLTEGASPHPPPPAACK